MAAPYPSFPASPTIGQSYTDANGAVWVYGNTGWEKKTISLTSDPSIWQDVTTATFGAGTAASPSISFSDDPNTGIYRPGPDQLAISTNGTGRLFVDASGNVGIGASSPANGRLNVSSTTNQIALDTTDTATYGRLDIGHFTNGTFIGTYAGSNTASDLIRLGTGGTERLRITSTGTVNIVGAGTAGSTQAISFNGSAPVNSLVVDSSGRCGIGTSSVSDKLEIANGTTDAANALGIRSGRYLNGAQEGAQLKFYSDQTASWLGTREMARIGAYGLNSDHRIGSLAFALKTTNSASDPTEMMRLTPTGLGIGVTNPVALLQPNGTVSITGGSSASSANGLHLYFDTATNSGTITAFHSGVDNRNLTLDGKTLGFTIAGTERARIDSSGRLLVGTSTAPTSTASTLALQGNSTNAAWGSIINMQRGTTNPAGDADLGTIYFGDSASSLGASISALTESAWGSGDYPSRLVFSTTADGASSPTERFRITNSGQAQLVGDGLLVGSTFAAGTSAIILQGYHSATAGTQASGTVSFRVYNNGNVQNTNNSYGAISDIKLKENIVDANSQWNDIKSLQVRNYNFKEGQTHTQIGLVAQEVELVSPGLVYESPDLDDEGNDLGSVTKSVNYSVLYMKAVKALQEAMERIETLEAKVAALEA